MTWNRDAIMAMSSVSGGGVISVVIPVHNLCRNAGAVKGST
jgi:hypothetical protein